MRTLGTVLLLLFSNAFMTTAWYYHLKKTGWGLLAAIGISWLIALPEYCLQVPANRLGHAAFGGPFTAPQLKVLQEAITLAVFAGFSIFVLHERLRWSDITAFVLIFAGVGVSQLGPRFAGASS
ncbi:MAG: membrane protein [Phycisphaerae bacterium]|nr:MAG: membrane protein [Phycisphaerae bacterium]